MHKNIVLIVLGDLVLIELSFGTPRHMALLPRLTALRILCPPPPGRGTE